MSDIVEQVQEKKYANKFFKLKIEKLLTKIKNEEGKPVSFNESQWDMVRGLEEHRFWVHIAGRRTGKSFAAATLALVKLLEPNTQVAVVAPTYNLSTIIWDYMSNFIRQLQLETERFSTKDRVIILKNGSVFRLLSVANRETLVGRGYHLVIVDEAAIIEDEEYFVRDIRPTLATYNDTRCLFISTPRGQENYLYNYFQRGQPEKHNEFPDWGSGIYPWWTNPRLNKADIDEARHSMTKTLFAQEYECSWLSFENMIYSIPEESLQSKVLDDIKKRKMDFIAGLDMGYRDETACIVIATDYHKFYIVDEYIVNETVTSEIAKNVKLLEEKYDLQAIYIDSQAQQTKADLANDYDVYCENALKGAESVNAGIAYLQNLCEKGCLIIDKDRCPRTLKALRQYKWKANAAKPTPVHDWTSHPSDAVRYAIYTHQKNQVDIYTG
jgi:phage terminase large subunit-like protein